MNLTLKELTQWRPDQFSEDHLTNFVKEFFDDQVQWHVAYHNPPSGSWKEITMIDDGQEYLQEIHKRGVGEMKRPDMVAQYLGQDDDKISLLLFESKQERSSWDPDLPEMMKGFFEGVDDYSESKGVRNVPFWHRRQRNELIWESLDKNDPERDWFEMANVSYVYGFGYLLGVTSSTGLSDEVEWMREQLSSYNTPPPTVVIAVGWEPETYEPFTVPVFSETFPEDLQKHLKTALPAAEEESATSLFDFED